MAAKTLSVCVALLRFKPADNRHYGVAKAQTIDAALSAPLLWGNNRHLFYANPAENRGSVPPLYSSSNPQATSADTQ